MTNEKALVSFIFILQLQMEKRKGKRNLAGKKSASNTCSWYKN